MTLLRQITNPIEWQETQHQRRTIAPMLRRWRITGPISLIIAFVIVALTLRDITSPTRELTLMFIWIVHAMVGARAIAAGANAISREHLGATWTPLVLTGISARRILMGKWLGVLHQTAPWMLALGALRLVMLPIFMLALVNRFAWRTSYRSFNSNSMGYYGSAYYANIDWVAWAAVLAVIMTVVLTVLEIMCCTALGLAASAAIKRGWLALIAAICIRFMPVLMFAAFTRYEVGLSPSWRVLRFTPLAIADSGSAPLYQLTLPLTVWTNGAHEAALIGLAMAGGLLVALLIGSLVVAWASIRAAGALPEAKAEAIPVLAVNPG